MESTRPLEPQKRAIVVGASSGIGAALVRELVHSGYTVAAIARREAKLQSMCDAINASQEKTAVLPIIHNVTNYDEVPTLFQQIVSDLGGLDLIIYNAGILQKVSINEYNFEKDKSMMEINTLGAIAWLNQAAARFERAKAGHIVGVG
ncbi:MAG: SDR family NAD(P)-dependent oxidoreductase, partial [Chloroflexota bacterium]